MGVFESNFDAMDAANDPQVPHTDDGTYDQVVTAGPCGGVPEQREPGD